MNKHLSRLLAVVFGFALSGSVFAHPGHDVGNYFSGAMHPLSGWDHLSVMLAIGFWSATVMQKRMWLPVTVFATAMVMGLLLGMSGVALANAELGITASVIFMGLLLMSARQGAAMLSIALIGFFAVFHGYAHGVEMPQMAQPITYGAGMFCTTVLLHLAGIGLGLTSSRLRMARLNRLLGLMLSGLGVWLMVGNI